MRISLIGTVHEARGLANAAELEAILRRIRPKVIFAEMPATHIEAYESGDHGSLESLAMRGYRDSHEVTVVPVDLAKPDERFFGDAKELFNAVERTSNAYRRMIDQHSANVEQGGFPYINSRHCIQAWRDIYGEVKATVEWTGSGRLLDIYERWVDHNGRRDTAMVRNIEQYCARNNSENGVFLVGCAHRGGILENALAFRRTQPANVEWIMRDMNVEPG